MNKLPLLLGGFGGRGRVFSRRLRRLFLFLSLKQISLETSNVVVDVEERRVGLGPATDVGHEEGRKKEGQRRFQIHLEVDLENSRQGKNWLQSKNEFYQMSEISQTVAGDRSISNIDKMINS